LLDSLLQENTQTVDLFGYVTDLWEVF